ncbi:hypothetical protein BURMUCF2_B0089 [Burkholderia multivorans CF2]|nr:hypothetical protein BURMUCF2_B0089 [Burkholderia multivorans CF2]
MHAGAAHAPGARRSLRIARSSLQSSSFGESLEHVSPICPANPQTMHRIHRADARLYSCRTRGCALVCAGGVQ